MIKLSIFKKIYAKKFCMSLARWANGKSSKWGDMKHIKWGVVKHNKHDRCKLKIAFYMRITHNFWIIQMLSAIPSIFFNEFVYVTWNQEWDLTAPKTESEVFIDPECRKNLESNEWTLKFVRWKKYCALCKTLLEYAFDARGKGLPPPTRRCRWL